MGPVQVGFPIDPTRVFSQFSEYWEELILEEQQVHSRIPRRYELDSGMISSQEGKIEQGEEILISLRKCLDEFRLDRTDPQIRMHDAMITSCLPKILGPEYDRFADKIKREQGWDE